MGDKLNYAGLRHVVLLVTDFAKSFSLSITANFSFLFFFAENVAS
jgi:hypothetical protein